MKYHVSDLTPTSPGAAFAINEGGQVVGRYLSGGQAHAFLWDPKNRTIWGHAMLRRPFVPLQDAGWKWLSSIAFALTDDRFPMVVGGASGIAEQYAHGHAFLCSETSRGSTAMTDLDKDLPIDIVPLPSPVAPSLYAGIARGVRSDGTQAVGQRQLPLIQLEHQMYPAYAKLDVMVVPEVWDLSVSPARPTTLDTGDHGGGKAAAINGSGMIVGRVDTGETDALGFPTFVASEWRDAGQAAVVLPPLFGQTQSYAWGLNDEGVAVGTSGNAIQPNVRGEKLDRHACYWPTSQKLRPPQPGKVPPSNGFTAHEIPFAPGVTPPSSWAFAVNDDGTIVGELTAADGTTHAFVYDVEDGAAIDLNDIVDDPSLMVLTSARGINASGDIVGYGMVGTEQHAFLLTT